MTMPDDAQQRVEAYLGRLRQRLRGVKDEEVGEIVEELRSHIMDKVAAGGEVTAAGVDAALAALGSPEELASQYITDNLLARAEVSRSPLQILKSLFRWASLSVAGFFVLLGSLVGYFFGIVLMLVAVAKLFHPRTAGLWTYRDSTGDLGFSFRLGFGSAPGTGNDVLGWWIVPIGWLAGCGLVMLTTHIAVWFVRQYRRSRVLP
jgi:membrane protein YqaA with SNARE-associated domain